MVDGKGPILLVEDDRDVREALRDALEDEGYLVVEAHDGQMALDYLVHESSAASDLPQLEHGAHERRDFMGEVSKDAALSKVPVVLLTADARAKESAKNSRLCRISEEASESRGASRNTSPILRMILAFGARVASNVEWLSTLGSMSGAGARFCWGQKRAATVFSLKPP